MLKLGQDDKDASHSLSVSSVRKTPDKAPRQLVERERCASVWRRSVCLECAIALAPGPGWGECENREYVKSARSVGSGFADGAAAGRASFAARYGVRADQRQRRD